MQYIPLDEYIRNAKNPSQKYVYLSPGWAPGIPGAGGGAGLMAGTRGAWPGGPAAREQATWVGGNPEDPPREPELMGKP